MHRLNRNVEAKIDKLLSIFPVVVILGARQVGKTTVCKNVRPDWKYFDLQNYQHSELILNDPIGFFNNYPKDIIIDEAQESLQLLKTLRVIIDQQRDLNGRFLLTGSSSPEILHQTSETLAGRVGIIELGSMKANEIFSQPLSNFFDIFNNLDSTYDILEKYKPQLNHQQMNQTWLRGGYPQPCIKFNQESYDLWMENYFSTYVNTDIVRLFPKLKKHIFQRFLKMISLLNATIVNKRNLGRNLETNEKTISEYINIAIGTFLWNSLPGYKPNASRSLISMPKGYIRDSGLLHHLIRINSLDDLLLHPSCGGSFESFIIEEIIKGLESMTIINWNSYYYRTKHQAEIDLILEGPFGLLPIEIKHCATVKLKQLTSLSKFIEDNNLKIGLVINTSNELIWLKDKILQVPFTYL